MKNKLLLLGLILIGASSLPASADSFYLNLGAPGVQIGVGSCDDDYYVPGYWYYGGERFYGPPVAPRYRHDKKAWKRYEKKQKAYRKYLKECRKADRKYYKSRYKHHKHHHHHHHHDDDDD